MAKTHPTFRRGAALVLSALILLPALAWADNTADEADLRFERGVASYRARKYEDALAEFFHSNRLVPNRNVLHNIARCYEQLGRFDEAYRYYNDVLAQLPEGEDREPLEASLERLAPRVALVRIETRPPGAEIFVERKDLGSRGMSPATLALPPGETTVILSLQGYREQNLTVEMVRGEKADVDAELEFIYGRLSVTGPPEGAEVRLDREDGELIGTVPEPMRMAPGRHILHVAAPGHVAVQVPVEIVGDEETVLAVELDPLPPPTGTLVVTANHDGALVVVNEREMGFTPAVLELPVGPHRLEVSMPEMSTHDQAVDLEEGERMLVQAELRFMGAKTTAASKVETPVEEAPASITVIRREEIDAFGYTSLPEALSSIRGLFLSNDRIYEYLGVRGFSPPGDLNNRILILYDGHTMNDVYAGQAYLGRENSLDLDDVERIEVVRGPVSSLFGSAAFLGVINIVPRERPMGRSLELSASAGSLGLARARGTLSHRGEDTELTASFGAMTTTGEDVFFLPQQGELPEVAVRDRDGERVLGGHARARYKDFTLLGRYNTRSKDVPTGAYYTLLEEPSMEMHDQRSFVEARYQPPLREGASMVARAYYDCTRYSGRFLDEVG
ncbi:MAG: PEGA domain-containing protein, partial [Myxococcota bacterium]